MHHFLAIDQGTSGTKAIVVDEAGQVVSIAEVAVRPEYLAGGGVEQDPEALFDSVVTRGPASVGAGGRSGRGGGPGQPGRDRAGLGPRHRAPADAGGGVAGPAGRVDLCAAVRRRPTPSRQRTGLVLDPYFSAPKMAWIRANMTTAGVVTTTDTWLVHRLCGAFVTDASTASRSLLTATGLGRHGTTSCSGLFGLTGEALPEIVGCDQIVGSTDVFGADDSGRRADRRPAGRAAGRKLPDAGRCQVHVRHRARSCWRSSAATPARSTSGLTTSVAWRLREHTSYCVDGQVYTAASAVRWAIDLGLVLGVPTRSTLSQPIPATACCACPRWPGWRRRGGTRRPPRRSRGMTLSSGRGQLVRALLEGIAAQVAALADLVATDLGQPLTRLRVDGGLTRSRGAHAGAGRPGAHPRRRLPVAARHRARRRRLRSAGARPGPRRDGRGRHVDTRSTPTSREWSADRAAEFMARWMRAAESVLAQTETTTHMSGTPGMIESDVVVVGGGIVGCAIARALAGTNLSVTLLEARDDVGDGTSKANTAMLHTGFDATPGHPRVAAGRARLRAARRLRRADRHPGRAHRRAARRVDRRGARRAARPEGQGRTKRLPPLRDRRPPTRCTGGFPTSVQARWAG